MKTFLFIDYQDKCLFCDSLQMTVWTNSFYLLVRTIFMNSTLCQDKKPTSNQDFQMGNPKQPTIMTLFENYHPVFIQTTSCQGNFCQKFVLLLKQTKTRLLFVPLLFHLVLVWTVSQTTPCPPGRKTFCLDIWETTPCLPPT